MKCIYAVPPNAAEDAQRLCSEYATALSTYSENTVILADEVRAFAEEWGASVMKLDDDEWRVATEVLARQNEGQLSGELFWSTDGARRVHRALEEVSASTTSRALSGWLGAQADRDRSIVLVSG